MLTDVLYASAIVGGLGLLFGAGLGLAGKFLSSEGDERVSLIKEILPGANCGGCGFPGCDGLASAIVEGVAEYNACPVGGAECAERIGNIMGGEPGAFVPHKAFVKCSGSADMCPDRYDYIGVSDCQTASLLYGGGAKGCRYGCVGLGSCVKACPFGAISVVNGAAVVEADRCVGCGACVAACPKGIIEVAPEENRVRVACATREAGRTARIFCKTSCLSCKLCEKACERGAIKATAHAAVIDYGKCDACGRCADQCPAWIIKK